MEAAQTLLGQPDVVIVDAVLDTPPWPEPLAGAIRWMVDAYEPTEAPELPQGRVLLVGSNEAVAYRSAAALARTGNPTVYLCIPNSTEERQALQQHALQAKEISRGPDS